ncbi:MAG TPA: flagellar cap protein FliD N-terminal domain-containing protein, partial [Lacipirellulaceae bacterium]|nr:flagellar cap protein FliD N-terminal domain-containing protein [Lacipirellulaceae bacterium]
MSRITSSVGLITGIPIEDTVNQLIQVAARPRNILQSRTDGLKNQQLAIDALGSRLLSLQFAINKFKTATVFQAREVVSSNADVVRATITPGGTATVGAYQVRSVQTAAAQQFVSQPLASATAPLGGGSLSLQFGGEVDRGVELSRLNAGAGVTRGKIRITDRSGAAAIIDLSYARTVDDVLQAINSASDIDVRASANGDSFQLSDHSGGSGNLRVQEVGGGTTAAGLGLAGINAAADQVEGLDVYRLHAGFKLAWLNDGNGVDLTKEGVVDLEVSLADGTELSIDLHDAATIGDVIERINAAGVGKLSAAIAADGRRLELTDSTAGAGEFRIANGVASAAADELGIAAAVTGESTVTGSRLVAGLRDSLLSRLRGGAGVGPLGDVAITDRNGASATVDLSGAETLSDVIAAINGAGVGVTASINAARNGIVVKDISGGSGNLIVADADSTNSAQALGLAVDDG